MRSVVVVGAGLSGLVAAYTISKNKKYKVTIVEKDDFVGGRASTKVEKGFVIDSSAQLIFGNFTELLKLCGELNLQKSLIRIGYENIVFYKNKKNYPLNLHGLLKYTNWKEKFELIKLIRFLKKNESSLNYTYDLNNNNFSNMNFSVWFKKNYSESLFDRFAQPIVSSNGLAHPEKMSASYGLALLNSSLRKKIYSFDGGIGAISKALKQAIQENGGKIITGNSVKKIRIKSGTVKGITVNKKFISADAIISSIPTTEFKKIYNYDKSFDDLKKIKYSPCIHLWIAFKEKVLENNFAYLLPRIEWKDHLAIIDSSIKSKSHVPKEKSMLELFIFEEHAEKLLNNTDKQIKDKLMNDLSTILGLELNDKINWYKLKRMSNGMPIHSPNHIKKIKCLYEHNIKGLYFCGDYLGGPSLETAVFTGLKSAKQVML